MPRPMYFLATLTTRRRFASVRWRCARAPSSAVAAEFLAEDELVVAELVAQALVGEPLGERDDRDLLADDAYRLSRQDARVDGELDECVANVLRGDVPWGRFAWTAGKLRDGGGDPSLRISFEFGGDLRQHLGVGLSGQLRRHAEILVAEDAERGVLRRVEGRGELGEHLLPVSEAFEHHHDDLVRLCLAPLAFLEIARHALDVAPRLHLAREDVFILGGEKIDAPDLAQVHAHRVVQHFAVLVRNGRRLLAVAVAGKAVLARGDGQAPQHRGQLGLPVVRVAALLPPGDGDAALGERLGEGALAIAFVAVGDA